MNDDLRRRLTHVLIGIGFLLVLVLGYPDLIEAWTNSSPAPDPGIPTSFSGNRLAYGFAFFSLFSLSTLSIRQLVVIAAQLRAEGWRQDPDVGLYRMTLGCAMIALVLGAAPDVILLLLWGEASDATMTTLMTIDRICDGLTIVPFIPGILLRVRADQFRRSPSLAELEHCAADVHISPRSRSLFVVAPTPESIAENVKIVIFVFVIAAGLVAFK